MTWNLIDKYHTCTSVLGPLAMAGRVLWIGVSLSVLLFFCPSMQKFSWDWLVSFFLKLSIVLDAHVLLCEARPYFWKKSFCPQNWENGPKSGFFEFIGKISHFFLNLVYKENLYLLYCCTNPILAKNLISEIWVECSWPIRLHFKLTISLEQKQWKSLIFCMLMQVHRN